MRRALRTAVAVTAVSLSSAPAALAMPARDAVAPGHSSGLTAAQVRAIDGHQPPDPLPAYPDRAQPLTATDDGSGFPWVLLAVPAAVGLVGGAVRTTSRHVHLRVRRTEPGA